MPYISPEDRPELKQLAYEIARKASTPGMLNYAISCILNKWLLRSDLSYTNLNTLIGVLEAAKLELYRRVAAPYEDQKCADNGDVYTIRGGTNESKAAP